MSTGSTHRLHKSQLKFNLKVSHNYIKIVYFTVRNFGQILTGELWNLLMKNEYGTCVGSVRPDGRTSASWGVIEAPQPPCNTAHRGSFEGSKSGPQLSLHYAERREHRRVNFFQTIYLLIS